jgi:hypothetical protein
MQIIVPYATNPYLIGRGLRPEVRALLDGRAEFVDVGASNYEYWGLLERLWAERRGFCVVEQDNLPTEAALAGLEACVEPWCLCPYWHGANGMLDYGLGCTRFRAEVMVALPDLFVRALGRTGTRHWSGMDLALAAVLHERGFRQHVHEEIAHLHEFGPESEAAQERHLTAVTSGGDAR